MKQTQAIATGLGAAMVLATVFWWASRAQAEPACQVFKFEGSVFTACRYDPARQELRLFAADARGEAWRDFRRLQDALGSAQSRLAFAMNAGMYDDDGAPIGLYVENGVERRPVSTRDGPGNFHLKPNGVFWVEHSGAAHVAATDAYLARERRPAWATQSGPMLVVGGALHPKIAPNGSSQHVRNGVGASCGDAGGGAVFVISERVVSFGRLARLFRDQLHCRDALYFDGAVSSLWVPDQGRMDTGYRLGPIVAVFARELQR